MKKAVLVSEIEKVFDNEVNRKMFDIDDLLTAVEEKHIPTVSVIEEGDLEQSEKELIKYYSGSTYNFVDGIKFAMNAVKQLIKEKI